jgi:large subunit ribosomal protein L29
MKYDEVTRLTTDQLSESLLNLKKEQFNLRFQAAVPGGLEKTHRVNEVRKDIARIKTLLRSQKTAV